MQISFPDLYLQPSTGRPSFCWTKHDCKHTKPCFQDKKLSNSECLKNFFFHFCKFRQYTISRRWWYKPRGSGKSSRAGKIKARSYQTGRGRKANKTQENGGRTRKYETRDKGQSELQIRNWRLMQKKDYLAIDFS